MVDDAISATPAPDPETGPAEAGRCPWCSAALPVADAEECPSCRARLVEEAGVEIPGLTSVDPVLLAAAAAPRKVKRNLATLLVGNDNETPLPSQAEMPALALPAADVRREMIRLEMDARLASLQAEVSARNADGAVRLARDAAPEAAPVGEATLAPAGDATPDAGPETAPAVEALPAAGPAGEDPPGRG
jgi:hypothetical protein